MKTIAERETRITRVILIALLALYVMVAYKDIKKGFIAGYDSYPAGHPKAKHASNGSTEVHGISSNRSML